jgi:hypothetical protein
LIAGIWPLVSVRNAEFMKNELRVSVPDSILERMARAHKSGSGSRRRRGDRPRDADGLSSDDAGRTDQRAMGRYSSAVDVLEALGTEPAASR